MDSEHTNQQKSSGYVFRVLYGALNGIEFSLGAQEYFICVGDPEQGNHAQNLAYSERTLFLPGTDSSHNFTVNLNQQTTNQDIAVTVSYPDRQETLHFAYNQICSVGDVIFSIKREDDIWADDIIKGSTVPLTSVEATQIENRTSSRKSASIFSRIKWVSVLFLFLFIAGAVLVWLETQKPPATSLSKLQSIVGNRSGYFVFPGSDNVNYVFTQTRRESEWARQAVARNDAKGAWKIVTPAEEEERLARLLERTDIHFFTIRFNDPSNPVLVLSSTRNPTDDESLTNIKKLMLTALPYASNVDIDLMDDKDLIDKAQQGLRALGFQYKTIRSDSGVTLMSSLPTLDIHLGEFGRFVEQFYRIWGRHYVHFSAELSDDWSKDKSFKYTENGYISMNKSHWIFKEKDPDLSDLQLN